MSFFAVTINKIATLRENPEAAKLETATLEGMAFEFCVQKGKHVVGEEVVYFPIDSIIPETVLHKMGLKGKLSGAQKNRLKTIKLRGQISQGLVVSPSDLEIDLDFYRNKPDELTAKLGVTKYDPEAPSADGTVRVAPSGLARLPCNLGKYDIEGCDRYQNVVDELMDKEVEITEKLEGSNFSVTVTKENGPLEIFVNQRNYTILEPDGTIHPWWAIARNVDLIRSTQAIFEECGEFTTTLYCELVGPGIQQNYYKLHALRPYAFDIRISDTYLDPQKRQTLCFQHQIPHAPVLHEGTLRAFLNGRTVQVASNGESVINRDLLREGIVIKPMVGFGIHRFGRAIIKQRDPIYLSREA